MSENNKGLTITMDLLNLDITKEIIGVLKYVVDDERIDKKIRDEYSLKILKIAEKNEFKIQGKEIRDTIMVKYEQVRKISEIKGEQI